jgi:SPP1 family predicted phage head-tail adaptor
MQAGKLDRKIVIQESTQGQTAAGEVTNSISTHATVWANVRQVAGREPFRGEREIAQADTIFKIRYLSTVTPKMQISYNGLIYNIISINELGRREAMEIMTQVTVA